MRASTLIGTIFTPGPPVAGVLWLFLFVSSLWQKELVGNDSVRAFHKVKELIDRKLCALRARRTGLANGNSFAYMRYYEYLSRVIIPLCTDSTMASKERECSE
jgi:hypothetical protein